MAEKTEYHVSNLMEELVDVRLDEDMRQAGVCTCHKCRADVFALALNHLPPQYVVTDRGNVFSHLSSSTPQSQAEIMVAVTTAIRIVGANPRHDD
jgi:competence protein ComFB